MKIKIYTDGSCIGNPGPGGWAAVITGLGDGRTEIKGCDWHTTSGHMETTAVLGSLKTVAMLATKPESLDITIYTDAQYVANHIETRNIEDFTMSDRYKNSDLWAEIFRLIPIFRSVKAEWVRGHAGQKDNEYVDKLARAEARKCASEVEVRRFTFGQLLLDPEAQAVKVYHHSGCRYSLRIIQKYINLYRDRKSKIF